MVEVSHMSKEQPMIQRLMDFPHYEMHGYGSRSYLLRKQVK